MSGAGRSTSERARFPKAKGLRESEDVVRELFPRRGNSSFPQRTAAASARNAEA